MLSRLKFFAFVQFVRLGVQGGKRAEVKFPNGYGASVIHGSCASALADDGEYELAVLKFDQAGDWKIVDVLPDGAVLGHLKFSDLYQKLDDIQALTV